MAKGIPQNGINKGWFSKINKGFKNRKHSEASILKMSTNARHRKGTKKEYIERRKERTMTKHYEYKKIVFDYYGNKCNCCGENNPFFLQIDHVDNDGYKEKTKTGKRISGATLYCKIIKSNFPDKYQILCANCNQGKKINDGVCPHILLKS